MGMNKNNQNKVLRWVKDHRGELIWAGIGITIIAAGGYYVYSQLSVDNASPMLPDMSVKNVNSPERLMVAVDSHVRNLPEGWYPSTEKVTTALANGFVLAEGQTWVASHSRSIGA